MNDRAERFVCVFNFSLGAIDHRVNRIAERVFAQIGFTKLKTITQHRDVPSVFAQLLDISLRFFAETIEQEPAIMLRRENLRTFCVDFSVTDADLIDPVHQLGDQIKIETGVAKSRDLSLRSDNHMRVFNRVIEVVSGHGNSSKLAR